MATGLSATPAPAQLATQPARGHGSQNVSIAAVVGRGPSLATVAAKLVVLCAVGTGLVGGPLGVNGQTLTTATTVASAAVATAAPLDIATPISTTTAHHHSQGFSSDFAPASISGSDFMTSVAKPAAEPTTVSVWIPGYGMNDWENRRGSIISSVGSLWSSPGSMVHVSARGSGHHAPMPTTSPRSSALMHAIAAIQDASMTAYTIFCAEGQPDCAMSADAPFVFTEGPRSLKYTGIAEPTFKQEMHCNFNDTTTAVCAGTSTVGPHYVVGTITGPATTTWTSTYSSPNITWVALTLATPGPLVGTTDIDGTAVASVTGGDPYSVLGSEGLFAPTGAPKNGAAGGLTERMGLLGVAAVAGVVGGVLML
ncbi:hypothetical protein QBC32DRAFT_319068 [Pseudoneurospora amorphoporcata]|uniref:Uncharacterized protein n=1 Tax=Pseudoneurospora amorphoporcata TaxID=241081 RepID=A0AAN6NLV3_9PEZI|nr:hypothetical protein QBC32DRAFT_319068 [Pseudoneurospora amorphoporcata]